MVHAVRGCKESRREFEEPSPASPRRSRLASYVLGISYSLRHVSATHCVSGRLRYLLGSPLNNMRGIAWSYWYLHDSQSPASGYSGGSGVGRSLLRYGSAAIFYRLSRGSAYTQFYRLATANLGSNLQWPHRRTLLARAIRAPVSW